MLRNIERVARLLRLSPQMHRRAACATEFSATLRVSVARSIAISNRRLVSRVSRCAEFNDGGLMRRPTVRTSYRWLSRIIHGEVGIGTRPRTAIETPESVWLCFMRESTARR